MKYLNRILKFPGIIFIGIGLCVATLYMAKLTYTNSLPPSVGPANAQEICAIFYISAFSCRENEVYGIIKTMFPVEAATREQVKDALGFYISGSYIPSMQEDTIIDEYVIDRPSLLGPNKVIFSFTKEGVLKDISFLVN